MHINRTRSVAALAFGVVALSSCGKTDTQNGQPDPLAKSAGAIEAKPATGKSLEVKMLGDATGYRFDPKDITIDAGDAVRWVLVSGGPHDVTFWPDSIPSGAEPQLQANMPNTIGPLTAPMTTAVGETYTVSFAGVAPGVYHYYCTPHLSVGMVGTVTVK